MTPASYIPRAWPRILIDRIGRPSVLLGMGSNRLAVARRDPRVRTVLLIAAAPAVTALAFTLRPKPVPLTTPVPVVAPVCPAPVCTVEAWELPPLAVNRRRYRTPVHPSDWGKSLATPRATSDDLRLDVDLHGTTVTIENTSSNEVKVETVSGALLLVQQVATPNGDWEPIERPPWDSCGVSYIYHPLGAGQSWTFPIHNPASFDRPVCRRFQLKSGDTYVVSNQFRR